jgi:hypothetical protein
MNKQNFLIGYTLVVVVFFMVEFAADFSKAPLWYKWVVFSIFAATTAISTWFLFSSPTNELPQVLSSSVHQPIEQEPPLVRRTTMQQEQYDLDEYMRENVY